MTVRNLEKIFRPQRIAVVGASDVPGKVGYTLLKNLIGSGYEGVVYPVNAQRESVQGVAAYKNLRDLPHTPDLAVICTPAVRVPAVVRQCGELGIWGVIVISAGFREIGAEGRALEQELRAVQQQYPGLRIIGPNCLGVIVPRLHLSASFAAGLPPAGRIAFVSQSGALCTAVLDWALSEGVGFSCFVSLGNALDIGFDDLLDYLAADSATEAVILYVESIAEAREFLSAARAFSRHKPIVAYKAGRFEASAKAASSHTGALAGVDAVYAAALQRAGVVRVFDVEALFGCAELLARGRAPAGPRLAIITNAGGPGVMACDALLAAGGTLAELSLDTKTQLDAVLPPFWSHGNPVDVLGDAPGERYAQAVRVVLQDPNVDAALVVLTPQAMTEPLRTAQSVVEVAAKTEKPVLAAWMGAGAVRESVACLNAGGVPTFPAPEEAVRSFMHWVHYARRRELLAETPREIPLRFQLDRETLRARCTELLSQGGPLLDEGQAKELLELYGIPTCKPVAAATAAQAAKVASEMGWPVVLKVHSPQITHKTDVKGVVLNLKTAEEVRAAFEQVTASAAALRPDAEILGVTVQRMVTAVNAIELILGVKRDPVFGPVIMVGWGGIAAEVFQDFALELPPLNERLARQMLESLRCWPLLSGYRGRPAVCLDRLVEILMRFSYMVAHLPEIREVDVNPLLVTADEAIALDARVYIDRSEAPHPQRPYAHLAICPYPEELTRGVTLPDGARLTLRPIKPEDEPLWYALLANCSAETLWRRFRYLFREATHEMAVRFCYLDYDREIALVAEHEQAGERRLVGVGRLVADADHEEAEYAVLVADAWQGRGLGNALTDACLEIARRWEIRRVTGETAPDNERMLRMFRRRGFALDNSLAPDVVLARLELTSPS